MIDKGIFSDDTLGVLKLFSQKKIVTVANLYGSSVLFFIRDLTQHVSPVLFVADNKDSSMADRELDFLGVKKLNLSSFNHPIDFLPGRFDVIIAAEKDLRERRFIDHQSQIRLVTNDRPGFEAIEGAIFKFGYHREYNVSEPLEYARRGGIIDLFPPDRQLPVRIEFEDENIVSIREFDPLTQRSIRILKEITISDAQFRDNLQTIFETIPEDSIIATKEFVESDFNTIILKEGSGGDVELAVSPPRFYFGNIDSLKNDVRNVRNHYIVFLPSATQIERIMNQIGDRKILSKMKFVKGEIKRGFIDNKRNDVYLTESELFGNITIPRPKPRFKGLFIDDLLGMKAGDYVVHRDYGIGHYQGLTRLKFDGIEQECLLIEYADGDRLYLSVEHINLIERYIGDKEHPPVSKLGGNWIKLRKKAKTKTERYVIELLDLYARRSLESGISFKPDYDLESAVGISFRFELTDDQIRAIDDICSDMEEKKPMDRLVCGDVGYGKTEVAIRSAVRAVCNGYQVAILCPTTILALQHFRTFKKRLASFPFVVEMLSRLIRNSEVDSILGRLASQKTDIIIGTHRLLNPDVNFKKLGLLIVDDEHRFGVKQKEMIKRYRTTIDVLMLTATPLPRTLYMSLTGIRDVSLISTPPVGRQDVKTEILEWDDDRIRRIVWQEIDRGGQVFFIHNRIDTIGEIKEKLDSLLPGIKICLIHGRLKESKIGESITDFMDGKYDILLSTSIIEAGIDMPNVNTIIVNQAHLFGLADLHQLRGRVGRSQIKGYAYFIIPEEENLSLESKKRLSALSVYCNLGSGFRLAIRDMEIRGIGNILGSEQHGVVNRIGYGLYMRLLKQTIAELKGKKIYPEPRLDLKIDAYIPDDYINDSYERIAIYKRLFSIEDKIGLTDIKEEIIDRFGIYPEIVENLFDLALIRLLAQQKGVESIYSMDENYIIKEPQNSFKVKKNLKKVISFLAKLEE